MGLIALEADIYRTLGFNKTWDHTEMRRMYS